MTREMQRSRGGAPLEPASPGTLSVTYVLLEKLFNSLGFLVYRNEMINPISEFWSPLPYLLKYVKTCVSLGELFFLIFPPKVISSACLIS